MKFAIKVLVLSVFACAAFVGLKNAVSSRLPSQNRGVYGATEMGEVDNLFMGSSLFRRSLAMDVLERELGEKSYVVTYNANQPLSILYELRQILDRGVKVKRLYVDMYAFGAASAPKITDQRIIFDLDFASRLALFLERSKCCENKISDAYAYFVLANNRYFVTYPVSNALMKGLYRKGAAATEALTRGLTQEEARRMDFKFTHGFKGLRETQKGALEELIALAKARGIRVVFIDTPKYVLLEKNPNYAAIAQEYEKFLKERRIRYVSAEDFSDFSEDPSNYTDSMHMTSKGGSEYTRGLCEKLLSLR